MDDPSRDVQIVIAEDNEDNLQVLLRRLERRGFQVAAARDGREALEQARRLVPPLVLMDLEMPVMSGFEALEAIRAECGLPQVIVVALTAHATEDMRIRCLAAGFDQFLTKPIDFTRLLETIARAGVSADAPAPAAGSIGGRAG